MSWQLGGQTLFVYLHFCKTWQRWKSLWCQNLKLLSVVNSFLSELWLRTWTDSSVIIHWPVISCSAVPVFFIHSCLCCRLHSLCHLLTILLYLVSRTTGEQLLCSSLFLDRKAKTSRTKLFWMKLYMMRHTCALSVSLSLTTIMNWKTKLRVDEICAFIVFK